MLLKQSSTGFTRKQQVDTSYEINDEFKSNPKQVLVLKSESESYSIVDEKEVQQAVNLDRKAYVESVLYKIMKKEKQMPRTVLID